MTASNRTTERRALPRAMTDAIDRFDAGDFDGCRNLLHMARRLTEPDVPSEVFLFEGLCERRDGRLDEAIALMREAVSRAGGHAYTLLELALALIENDQRQEGLDYLRQAVHASNDDPGYRHEFYVQNAIALYREGALEHAVTSLRKALKFGHVADTYRLLGHMLVEFRKDAEALTLVGQAIEQFPTDAGLHHIAGLALAMQRDHFGAAQAFARAIELDPVHGEPLHSLGVCFESLGDARRALDAYERCMRLVVRDAVREDASQRADRLRKHLTSSG